MSAVFLDPLLSDEERRSRLFAGDLMVLPSTAGTRSLVRLARDLLERAFAPHDPRKVHKHMTVERVASILSDLKPRFIDHPECRKLLPAIMAENGMSLDKIYFDAPRLRSAYPWHFHSSGAACALRPHRETWYAAPLCQINWWTPVYPLHPENAVAFYPRYFKEPVKNNSGHFNHEEQPHREQAAASLRIRVDTRPRPQPQQELDPNTVCLIPAPGSSIVFSAAHLHGNLPNTTDLARYSIDFRTVHFDDLVTHRGPHNIDSKSTGTTLRHYIRASDLRPLPDNVVRQYDQGGSRPDNIIYFRDRLAQRAEAH